MGATTLSLGGALLITSSPFEINTLTIESSLATFGGAIAVINPIG